uniref:Acetyl-coenzyme A transporter 1 n=1 Tax=Caenorhabditis japonica TaxID=281687 RepID=A0A8R1DKG8_CAEJA
MKLLWAPIVDSVYSKRFGRRKSWMVPCQYLIGIFMLFLSYKVNDIMGDSNGVEPNVFFLMLIFLPLNFLAATQDIAVDGWALTMLSKKNVGYASTCNAVGQTAGFFLGNVVFLALESVEFCNDFLRSKDNQKDTGIVDLAGYVFFWGWVFIVTTTLVMILKREVDKSVPAADRNGQVAETEEDEGELELGVAESYAVLFKILKLKPIHWMVAILLTGKLAFAASDGMTSLKLIDMGIPKARLASIGVFLTPVQILLPWLIGKWTAGPRPLNIFLLAFPYRIFIGGVFAALVWWTPHFRMATGDFENSVYIVWITGYIFHQLATYCMFVSMMAFIAQISDPRIGGTYMTLLNTLNNLGGNWPVTVVLAVADWFTYKDCVVKGTKDVLYACHTKVLADQCSAGGDVCEVAIDGYFISVAGCSVLGVIWYKVFFNRIKQLQKIPRSQWKVFGR